VLSRHLLSRTALGVSFALTLLESPACGSGSDQTATLPNATLRTETIASGLRTVWELAWGPDNVIWFTERPGFISRLDPSTGTLTRVGQLTVLENGEGGLMGLAFHPDFSTQPYVFVAHTYASPAGARNRVVRMRYDGHALGAPDVLIDNIPASSIHNGSRLAIGPDRLLYITAGDASNSGNGQDRSTNAGKILRLTLDGAPVPGNPFGSAIYSYGHRNPQGLVFAPTGVLYSSEHGPSDNDEINLIESGRNYGWPDVHGRCDGDVGSSEVAFCNANNVADPLTQWTPTIAPAALAYYDATLIPGWRGSLLLATLKDETLYRLTLSANGRSITGQERLFANRFGRLRAVLVAPDGSVYLGTSNRDGRGSPASSDDRIIRIRP
jgi:glucose/arabinose dehydrogenase